jgi:outer membrane biosynthesis protein TonB
MSISRVMSIFRAVILVMGVAMAACSRPASVAVPTRDLADEADPPPRCSDFGRPVEERTPSASVRAEADGAAPPPDAGMDASRGDAGATDAGKRRTFKFARYFSSVRRAISAHWHPDGEYRRRDPDGVRFGKAGRDVIVRVTTDDNGRILDACVQQTSELVFLDRIGWQAVVDSSPLGPPPPALLDEHGKLRFRFGFRFEPTSSARAGPR